MKKVNIAIDGPVASGKTTVARRLAKELKYRYIDTGAIYRAITWKALDNNIDIAREEAVVALAKNTKITIEASEENTGGYSIFVDDIDVTGHITSLSVRRKVSSVAKISGVRKVLVEQQKIMGRDKGIVMAGRDITSVVLPGAEVKIFLTASPEERARRRAGEIIGKGEPATYEEVLSEVLDRDKMDMERKDSPLIKVPDAVVVDSTHMTFEEVIENILSVVKEKQKEI